MGEGQEDAQKQDRADGEAPRARVDEAVVLVAVGEASPKEGGSMSAARDWPRFFVGLHLAVALTATG